MFRLYQVQLVKGDFYLARADSESAAGADANANRGSIYFTGQDGDTLPAAVNQNFPVIYAVPNAVQDPAGAAATLAPVLGMTVSTLDKILTSGSSYRLLVDRADASMAQQVTDDNIRGIYADYEPERYYPFGPVASQVLGYVGPDASDAGESGHYGIESLDNSVLAGGADVTLTIDPNVQIEAEKVLDALVAANNATGGSVIVEDPITGKVLAMGATPSFDPNEYASSSLANFLNPNVQSIYEPGSIMKVLTMAAGIDSGGITPDSSYDDKGYV
ncbi:MAG TPA: penicillin-binding transpeptidase domain-containing protein, partial [Candidatus Paceibacterota bacterium]|nr:penicillin-binding transpeptidase domain-containing protein [Candidatus Paceibacterota bacterium]